MAKTVKGGGRRRSIEDAGALFSAYDSDGGTTVDLTARTIPLAKTQISDGGFSLSGGEVTIGMDCVLEVCAIANVRPDTFDGDARSETELTIQKDDGAGSWSDIAGWVARFYTREFNAAVGYPGTATIHRIIPAWVAGESIRMRLACVIAGHVPDQTTFAGGSSLLLKVLRKR